MKLIREEIESVKVITEARKGGGKSLYIEGVFLQGNIKNRNGRMYPMETLQKEVGRYVKEHVDTGRALGELGHPDRLHSVLESPVRWTAVCETIFLDPTVRSFTSFCF